MMNLSKFAVLSLASFLPISGQAAEPVTPARTQSRGAFAMESDPKEIFNQWSSATEPEQRGSFFTLKRGGFYTLQTADAIDDGDGLILRPAFTANAPGLEQLATKLPDELLTFESFQKSLKTIQFWDTPEGRLLLPPAGPDAVAPTTYYRVEEDSYLNELELTLYYTQLRSAFKGEKKSFKNSFISADTTAPPAVQGALRAVREEGRTVRWAEGTKLSYCVLKWTFAGDADGYEEICRNAELAAADWESVCGVDFEYRKDLDNAPMGTSLPRLANGERAVLFAIGRHDLDGAIAQAFFPNDPIFMRLLLVDKTEYAATKLDKVGVFRHELGHVMGLQHEHISKKAPAWFSSFCLGEDPVEDDGEITRYDRNSVMHYPCVKLLEGNKEDPNDKVGNMELKLTEFDKLGIKAIYGPPGGPRPQGDRFKDFGF